MCFNRKQENCWHKKCNENVKMTIIAEVSWEATQVLCNILLITFVVV
jgi:hypothetical protein